MLAEGLTVFWNYLRTALELMFNNLIQNTIFNNFQALIELNFDKCSKMLTANNP